MKKISTHILLLCWLQACLKINAAENLLNGECITDFDPEMDYFPDKVTVEHSEYWNLTYANSYKKVTVTESPEVSYVYYFLQCGAPVPENMETGASLIEVPVDHVSLSSTTMIPHLELLGLRGSINGYVGSSEYISSACINDMIDDGSTTVYSNSSSYLAANPNGVSLVNNWATDKNESRRVVIMEAAEKSNIAIFEWQKLYGAMFNREKDSNDIFDETETTYECVSSEASELATTINTKEKIVWAYYSIYCDGWDVAECPNYYCEYAELCDADFLHSSEGSLVGDYGGICMNNTEFEEHAADADVWIYASSDFEDVYADNVDMLNGFASVQNQRVYDFSSNAWFEGRYAEPDVVLQDFCSVLNTGDPDHDRKWFRNIFLEPTGLPVEVCDDRAAPLEKEVVTCNPSSSGTRALASLWALTTGLMLTGRLILF